MKIHEIKKVMGLAAANCKGVKNQKLYSRLLELYKNSTKSEVKAFYKNEFKSYLK